MYLKKFNKLLLTIIALSLFTIKGFSSYTRFKIVFIEPADARYPSSRFRIVTDRNKIAHLLSEIKRNRQIRRTNELVNYALNISNATYGRKIYIAVYNRPSPLKVPFVTHYQNRYYFNLNNERIQGPIYHLSLKGAFGNKRSLKTAAFATGFIHEVGHILLGILVPDFPRVRARSRGVSSITNINTAFDEAIAELLEIFFMKRMPEYNTSKFLANIPLYWHRMEFGYFRGIGIDKNMFIWDEWNRARFMILKRKGYRALYSNDFLPKKKLRSPEQMMACEGVVVRILLNVLEVIVKQDSANNNVNLSRYNNWQIIKRAFMKMFSHIKKYKVKSIKEFGYYMMIDNKFAKYRKKIWKTILETTYYAFATRSYAQKYSAYIQREITPAQYNEWKRKTYLRTLKFYIQRRSGNPVRSQNDVNDTDTDK